MLHGDKQKELCTVVTMNQSKLLGGHKSGHTGAASCFITHAPHGHGGRFAAINQQGRGQLWPTHVAYQLAATCHNDSRSYCHVFTRCVKSITRPVSKQHAPWPQFCTMPGHPAYPAHLAQQSTATRTVGEEWHCSAVQSCVRCTQPKLSWFDQLAPPQAPNLFHHCLFSLPHPPTE